MRIPESARLFVGGVSPDIGDTELRDNFGRYGDVADIWLRRDRLTGLPRRFAFVQFMHPAPSPTITTSSTARRSHLRMQLYVGIAEPTKSSRRLANQLSKFLICQRICPVGNSLYRIGDRVITTLGPFFGNYEESEYVNNLRRFGVMKGNMLTFHCVIDYISHAGWSLSGSRHRGTRVPSTSMDDPSSCNFELRMMGMRGDNEDDLEEDRVEVFGNTASPPLDGS
uniref:RRM domain-containing protein n=1 Tax=Oryza punctata TaxID=4537 RepID=A0A0E0LH04_ORYPU